MLKKISLQKKNLQLRANRRFVENSGEYRIRTDHLLPARQAL